MAATEEIHHHWRISILMRFEALSTKRYLLNNEKLYIYRSNHVFKKIIAGWSRSYNSVNCIDPHEPLKYDQSLSFYQ